MRDKGCHFTLVRRIISTYVLKKGGGRNNSGENNGVSSPAGGWAWDWAWTLQAIDVALEWTSSTWISGLTGSSYH